MTSVAIHLITHNTNATDSSDQFYFEGSKQEVEGKTLTAMRVGGTTGSSALVGTAAAS